MWLYLHGNVINFHCLEYIPKFLPYHKSINSSNQKVVVLICYTCYKYLYFSCLGHNQSSGKEAKRRFIWRKRDPSDVNKIVLEFTQSESRNQDNAELDPIEYYRRFMSNELLDKIVDESNKYAIQSNPIKSY